MKTSSASAVAAGLLTLCFLGESWGAFLLVRKDGHIIWASNARREGDAVAYKERDSGEDRSMPVSEFDGIVPTVKRGGQYEAEQVQTFIDRLLELKAKHPRHLRTLNQLLQEWKSLQEPVAELDDRIAELVQKFRQGAKSTDSYKKVVLELGMMKYKDMRGTYAARIDEECAGITRQYVATSMKQLSETAAQPDVGIERFVAVRYLCEHLLQIVKEDEKAAVQGHLAVCREKALDGSLRRAKSALAAGRRSVDAYLAASRPLHGAKEEVASTEAQKADVERLIKALVKAVSRAQPAYRFDYRGYPLAKQDVVLHNKMKKFVSGVTFPSIPVSDQCLIIPRVAPVPATMGRPLTVPLRLVFSRAQPADRRFGMVVMVRGENDAHTHEQELRPFKVANGRADITFTGDLSKLGQDVTPVADAEGRTSVYVYLAYRVPDGEGQCRWPAISYACRWPLR